jgi:hypothetical protein
MRIGGMALRGNHLAGMFVAVTLLSMMCLVGVTSSVGVYNPWYDLDDDGDIDIFDVVRMAGAYSTSGDPLAPKAAPAYDSGWVDIRGQRGQTITFYPNVGNLETLAWFPRVHGRTVDGGAVQQRCVDESCYPPGWTQSFGGSSDEGWGEAVVQTSDGGYALAGSFWTMAGSMYRDFCLVKTDAQGRQVWNATYGGSGIDVPKDVVETNDGGYVLAGYTASFGSGDNDVWLVKFDSGGAFQWSQTYGGTLNDFADAVVQTVDGGFALACTIYSAGPGNGDLWLIKTDGAGNYQWGTVYGGTGTDTAYDVVQTSDEGYTLAGRTASFSTGGGYDFWLIRMDSAGNFQWYQVYGGAGDDEAHAMVHTGDGGYALAGKTSSFGSGGDDFWLVRTDGMGYWQWDKTFGGAQYDIAYDVVETGDGGFALLGQTNSFRPGLITNDFWLVKTDAWGNWEWDRLYGDDYQEYGAAIARTSDGGYVLGGTKGYFACDFWLIKTDAFGLTDYYEYGLSLVEYTADSITFYRGRYDPYWNYVRVALWIVKPTP